MSQNKSIAWQDVGSKVLIGTTHRPVTFRIDGRSGGFRTDQMTVTPWEVIDQGVPFETVEEAKAWVEAYYTAALKQNTVHPKIDRGAKS
jgi:hypothetical protein